MYVQVSPACRDNWVLLGSLQTSVNCHATAMDDLRIEDQCSYPFPFNKTPRHVLLGLRPPGRRGREKDPGRRSDRSHWKSKLAWVSHETTALSWLMPEAAHYLRLL